MADIKNGSAEMLLSLLQKGNTAAFDEIYIRYGQKMFGFFYKMLWKNKELAEDFTQDLFLSLSGMPKPLIQTKVLPPGCTALPTICAKTNTGSRKPK